MTKSELIKVVANNFDEIEAKEDGKKFEEMNSKAKAEFMINLIIGTIQEGLIEDGKVSISGFGTFSVKDRNSKQCVNPQSHEMMTVPSYKAAVFKAGKNLKEAVNK
ncbi:MAG: HU family DNA-binding protein [Oscillospiraceae bacterium]|nr:HU family DNA-binding protein [Oscillospiraceae bacterium]MDD6085280.1 HU family DNA-binding protein [Oscillospiraceae bacterium]MDY3258569.1 HU family DNA-binding protein [Ruminococcus callidus]